MATTALGHQGYRLMSAEGQVYVLSQFIKLTPEIIALGGKSNRTIENGLFAMNLAYEIRKPEEAKSVYQDPHMPQFKTPEQAAMDAAEFKGNKYEQGKVIVSDRQVGGTHYKDMNIEPWAAIKSWLTRDEWIGFLRGNIIKYQARANSGKGSREENLRKANHYAETLEITLKEGESTQPIEPAIYTPNNITK